MPDLDALVRLTIEGDSEAWQSLQAAAQPTVLAIARSHSDLRSKGLAALPDDIAEVVASTFERLSRSDYQNLRSYVAKRAESTVVGSPSFESWLYGAVDFTIREHIRRRLGRRPSLTASEAGRVQPSKRDLQSHAGRFEDIELERAYLQTLGMTARLTVAEIYEHVERAFGAAEARAMRLYYAEDKSFEQVAHELGLANAKDAEKMIRRLNARLRYRFMAGPDSVPEADD